MLRRSAIDGKIITIDGYFSILMPDHIQAAKSGYVLEHRMIMANKLGRKLLTSEIVHHKNGDKLDNREVNLEIVTRIEHMTRHKILRQKVKCTV